MNGDDLTLFACVAALFERLLLCERKIVSSSSLLLG